MIIHATLYIVDHACAVIHIHNDMCMCICTCICIGICICRYIYVFVYVNLLHLHIYLDIRVQLRRSLPDHLISVDGEYASSESNISKRWSGFLKVCFSELGYGHKYECQVEFRGHGDYQMFLRMTRT